jgi:hypothetical protein
MNTQYEKFIDELIDRRDFSDITPKLREQLRKEAMERLNNFLLNRMVDVLPDKDMKEFTTLIKEKKSSEDIIKFISNGVPNYEPFINEAFSDFAYIYLSQ